MRDKRTIVERHLHPLVPVPTGVAPDLSAMQPVGAMLFDIYGTLLISGAGEVGVDREPPAKGDGLSTLLRRYRIDRAPDLLAAALRDAIARSHADFRRQGIDSPEVDIVRIWRKVLGTDDMARIKDFALEYELIVNPVYPMPGLDALLTFCKGAGVPMGIISNAQFYTRFLLEFFLGATLPQRGFDPRLLFFSWREGHAKPSTFMFMRAKTVLLDMGIPAASVLYLGNDMLNDILPAGSVGFRTALFAGDRRSLRLRDAADRCRGLSPDLIVTDLRQLIAGVGTL
jgi:putative hydrolase of the HAD superfamily